MSEALAYVASGILLIWGVSHVVPTKKVVSDFGVIGYDNRQIIRMEWIAESLALAFVAILVFATALSEIGEVAAALNYRISAGFLVAIGALTTVTGAKTEVVWFKACPAVMGVAASLLVAASFI
jgi:hypothetical protein